MSKVAAYNWVVFQATCPVCGRAARMRAQAHVASSFDGDERGRFAHREYAVGQPFHWWPESHRAFSAWRDADVVTPDLGDPDSVEEACYTECSECQAELYAVVAFRVNVPVSIKEVGPESAWPVRYPR
ncbi:hypothetical protein HPC49_14435 [Pyxidicoccus fallax]|uniref:Uncharacterized protein n=1 Tax=Pyxidicoccus fallax TaxID=394095 RepID=A0A848LD61_9BACT|nr:hypothetical protein [Pyxidicoccus fallax]NMO17020.1 hypothetical protein [Pyxidicoccus fallax]NPC79429.1 hypothetical protein [Pyxidicoccus fallax]